jgi:hypothetical protein
MQTTTKAQSLEALSYKRKKVAGALLSTIQRDAVRTKTDMRCLEVSVDYLVNSAYRVFGWTTAQEVLPEVLHTLGVSVVSRRIAVAHGFPARKYDPRAPHGRFLMMPERAYERLVGLAAVYGVPVMSKRRKEDYRPLDAYRPTQKGFTARCPFHADRNPSTAFVWNRDGVTAGGLCFACKGVNGPLRLFAVLEDGVVYVRKATCESASTKPVFTSGTIYSENYTDSSLPTPAEPSFLDFDFCDRSALRHATRIRSSMRGIDCFGRNYGMEQTRTASMSLVSILEREESKSIARFESAKTSYEASKLSDIDHRQFVPDRFVGLDYCVGANRFITKDNRVFSTKWTSAAVSHVLVDLDGFTDAPAAPDALLAVRSRLEDLAQSRNLSGEVAVVRTSHRGLHIVFGLSSLRTPAWFSRASVRSFLLALGETALNIVRSAGFAGGHVDPATFAANRYVRAPGPRIDKAGELYRTHLVFATKTTARVELRRRVAPPPAPSLVKVKETP